MRRLLLVANPAASGFTGALHREVMAVLSEPFQVTSVWPTTAVQVRRLAEEAATDDFHLVVAFGGDGVVHHAANGLMGSRTGLGIIPAGSTNVLAKNLRLPRKPKQAAEFIADQPELRPVPVAKVEGEERSDHALFAAGIGYDAEVVEQAEREPFRKLRFGALHYARAATWILWSRFRNRPANLRVESEGRRADAVAVLVQVGRAYTYLGRLPISFSKPPQGLSVLVIERLDPLRVPSIIGRGLLGLPLEAVPGLQVWTGCSRVRVEAEPPAWLQSDGELQGQVGVTSLSRVGDGLLVAAPPRSRVRSGP